MKAILTNVFVYMPRIRLSGMAACFTAAFLLAFGWPQAAMAQASYLGDIICNVSYNLYPPGNPLFSLGNLINGIAYIAGAIAIGAGLVGFMHYHHNPMGETKYHKPMAQVIGGAALLAFPAMTNWLVNSLALSPQGSGITSCDGEIPTIAGGGTTLDVLLTNLVLNIKDPMTFFLSILAYTIGAFLMVRGLIKASKYGFDPRTNSVSSIAANLIIGAILFVVGQSLDVMLGTVFGANGIQGSSLMYSWSVFSAMDASPQFGMAVYAALTFIQIIGMIAFIRGWLILKDSVEGKGQATVAQGLTHVLGGVLAINIYYFLEVMDNTFGTGLLS